MMLRGCWVAFAGSRGERLWIRLGKQLMLNSRLLPTSVLLVSMSGCIGDIVPNSYLYLL